MTSFLRKVGMTTAALALVFSLVGVSLAQAAALSSTQISAIVSLLQSFGADATTIANVQASLTGTAPVSMPSAPVVTGGYNFTRDLTLGSTGADVTALQQTLVSGGYLVMPAGAAFGYFGTLTQSALAKWQAAMGITPAAGYFGPITRAKFVGTSSGSSTSVGVTGVDLKVALAATSPASSAIVAGQAAANLAEFTFTNTSATPAVVTNVTLARGGISSDTTLSSVYLYNGAVRLTDSATVSSGKITFNAGSGLFTIPAGSAVTISVRADIISSASAGQIVNVSLTGVTANIGVAASYPVMGSSFTVASAGDIASTTIGTNTISSTVTVNAGALNYTIWQAPLNITNRAVFLKSAAFKVIGSIPSNALQNVMLYASGIEIAKSAGIDANGILTFDLNANPYRIESSRTLEVRADIVSGSSRSFSVSLQNAADLQVVDSSYNVGIATGGLPNSTANITVGVGNTSVTVDSTLSAGNITTGATNVALARYTFKAFGEDQKISYLQASSTDDLDNVALYANGVQIGSTQTVSSTSLKLYNLGSSLIIPAGSSVTVEIRGDIKFNGNNATTTSNTIQLGLVGFTNNTQGSYSQQLSTVPGAEVKGPVFTVVGAGLTLGQNAAYLNQTQIPNTSNKKIGSYILQTNSSEAVKINSVTVTIGGTAGTSTNLSNLYIVAGSETKSPVAPQASNNFSLNNVTIPANGSVLVDVYADLGAATGTATTTLTASGYGVNSNVVVSQGPVTGQTVTVGAGSLGTPTLKTGSGYTPDAQFVVGNSQSNIAYFNFVSSNGDSTVQELYFTVSGGITSLTAGGVTAPAVSGVVTLTGLNIPVMVGFAGANIPVAAKYSPVGLNGTTSVQDSSITLTGFKALSGNVSQSTTTLSVASPVMVLVASKPAVTVISMGESNSGLKTLAKVRIAADSAGPVRLESLPLSITTSAAASVTSATQVYVNGNLISGVTGGIASVATGTTATGTLVFTGGYEVSAGSFVDLEIKANASFTGATGQSVQTALGTSSLFIWTDVNGNASTTGAKIFAYPTNSGVVTY